MNVLSRVMQAAWVEARKPIGHVTGEEFRDFVRNTIFPESHYILLRKTHEYITVKNDTMATSREPAFKFKSQKTEKEFYVDAKYRHEFHNGMLNWCKPDQLKRFQEIDIETPVYVVIGTGGQPGTPEKVCLIPMKHIRFTRLYTSILTRYQISSRHHMDEKDMMLLT
jgi:hypothetical protein